MTASHKHSQHNLGAVLRFLGDTLGPDLPFFNLVMIYGVGIGLLSLATPISVQLLINTVAYTGLVTPLVVLSTSLFVLLAIASLLNALRIHLMDLFSRRFYARMVSEVALRAIYALNPFFEDSRKGTLFNRYFDIVIVTKTVPNLLVGGFTIVLQMVVGFILVSLYHPLFLAFNVAILLLVWLIWVVWGRRAMQSAVELSHRKHGVAAWLEGLGASNGFFKSERHIDYALKHTDEMTEHYISQHRLHFRHHFSQTLALLLVYSLASALLLGLGGWLVIRGQLTIGQLVAAELVLSVVFVGISQLGLYLTYFYDLCAAMDELSLFYDVEQEAFADGAELQPAHSQLEFVAAEGVARGIDTQLNFELPAGVTVIAHAREHAPQRVLCNLLKGHEAPLGGHVLLGGVDLREIPAHTLRQQVIVLDRPNSVEMSMRELLRLSAHSPEPGEIMATLAAVGLDTTVGKLKAGLDTVVAPSGWPLSITETMQLKLASAILAEPRLLVLSQLYDVLPDSVLRSAIDLLAERTNGEATILFFSAHLPDLPFDHWLLLEADRQRLFGSRAPFEEALSQMHTDAAVS